jgi:DMSO reductase anchor subunit
MAARLLDAGHTRGTFLTREFIVAAAPGTRSLARAVFLLAGIAVPLLWLLAGLPEAAGGTFATLACLAGIAAERWLFFVEARHTVRLYHGDAAA